MRLLLYMYHIYNLQFTFQQGFNTLKECTVCYDRDISQVFVPCGHTTCLVYGFEIESRTGLYPTCRNVFNEQKPLFM